MDINEFDQKFSKAKNTSEEKFKEQIEFIRTKEAVPGERTALIQKAVKDYSESLVYNFLKEIFVDAN